jgi:hypothetical protein
MDVKSPNTEIPVTVPAQYQRAILLLQHVSHPSASVSPDDIVDCVELQSGKTLPAKRQIITYRPSDSPRIRNKGQIIDTWI